MVYVCSSSFFHACIQVEPSQGAGDESSIVSELQNLRAELESSEEQRKTLVTQLSEANGTVTQLREEGSCKKRSIVHTHA